MGLAVITAIYGSSDNLRELPHNHGFDDAVCVTDNPDLSSETWRIVYQPKPELSPRLAAKTPKMIPWIYTQQSSSVWVDGSMQIRDQRFRDFVAEHLHRFDFVVWDHPESRDCLYQEATYCQDWPKYRNENIREQVEHYRRESMPEHFGLFAAGTVGMNHVPAVRRFGEMWLAHQHAWSIQDQISLPFLAWQFSQPVGTWDAHQYHNDLVIWHKHNNEN